MSDPLTRWLDRMARKTGIPNIIQPPYRRRHLRWWPLIALIPAIVGMAIILASPSRHWLGYGLVMIGFAISTIFPMAGPIKRGSMVERVDEWDRSVRRRAYFFTFMTISIVAWLGIWVLLGLSVAENWSVDTLRQTLMPFSFLLMTLYSTLPTLHGSWSTRPIEDDE